jgi:hypothetical protein
MMIFKMHWRGLMRKSLESLLSKFDSSVPRSAEEQAWLDMAPVGMEFGSPELENQIRKSLKEV